MTQTWDIPIGTTITIANSRARLNNALQAAKTLFAGSTDPTTITNADGAAVHEANMAWLDTAGNRPLKIRNAANSAWVTVIPDTTNANGGFLRLDGTNSPSANVNWGGFKITNLAAAGAASNDAVRQADLETQIARLEKQPDCMALTFPASIATKNYYFFSTPVPITIVSAGMTSVNACATHASNYYTVGIRNIGTAGAGTTDNCSATTNSAGGTAITANTYYTFGTISSATIAASEMLCFRIVKTGTPTALDLGEVLISMQFKVT